MFATRYNYTNAVLVVSFKQILHIVWDIVHRRGSAKFNDAAPTNAHDYYNMENIRRTDDAVTSAIYQQLQLPRPFDVFTIYFPLTPADERWPTTSLNNVKIPYLAEKARDASSY